VGGEGGTAISGGVRGALGGRGLAAAGPGGRRSEVEAVGPTYPELPEACK